MIAEMITTKIVNLQPSVNQSCISIYKKEFNIEEEYGRGT